ncbi:MAG: nuclease-related domain-containing protein, partial [Myxococcota bacterium]
MAHMVPPQPPPAGSKPGIDAEREFFFALEAHLDDAWWVYHGLEYIETSRAEEGETDFLLVHREKGLYVIECKGRGVRPRPDGTWTRTYRGQVQRMHESPMEQAQDQVHDLTKALTRRVRRVWPSQRRLPFRFGHAAAFPLTAFGS